MFRIHRRLIAFTVILVTVSSAHAGLFRSGNTITVDRDTELQENLTAVGEAVQMYGVIHGDLIAAASTVFVDGYVDGQLLAAARTVSIHGGFGSDALVFAQEITVSDGGFEDFRGAAQTIILDVPIRGDVFAAGQYVTLGSDATVAGDAALAGQYLTVNGEVHGKLMGAGESVRIGALMHGDAVLRTDQLEFAQGGRIAGNLTVHYGKQKPEIPEGAVQGKVTFVQVEEKGGGCKWLLGIGWLLATIVTGWLLLLAFRRRLQPDFEWASSHLLSSLGFGFLGFAVVPMAIIVGAVLVLTIPVSVILLLLYAPLLYVGWIFGSWLGGDLVLAALTKKTPSPYLSLALGVILVFLIGLIPYVGGVVGFVVVLTGVGMLTKGTLRISRG